MEDVLMAAEQSLAAEERSRETDHSGPPVDTPLIDGTRLDPLEQESLLLNLDAALRVHARHQFFGWSQGTLQSLIPHELLICGLRSSEPVSFYVESFSALTLDLNRCNEMFRQDAALVPHLIKSWEKNRRHPLTCELAGESQFAGSALARELARVGATSIVAHGTYDVSGKLGSFFVFACRPGGAGSRQVYLAELIVPFLHSAWVRSQLNWTADQVSMRPQVAGLLTARELEIVKWLYYGKSNMEIGMILSISPLTVKNHVQKILRKLNVVNRTQAIGKALTLPILNI
jgi:transcriptional regulator EpsA